jgi:serine protease Do
MDNDFYRQDYETGELPQREDPPRNASFIPRIEAPVTPRQTAYTEPPWEPRRKKSGGIGKFIAAGLVCALLGGAAGGAATFSLLNSPADTNQFPPATSNAAEASQLPASKVSAPGGELSATQIYSLACEQVVSITTEITSSRNMFGTASVSGSGFIIREDGYILTNYHVIETAYLSNLTPNVTLYSGEKYQADIIGVESGNDIAILKIDASGLNAATMGNSDEMQVGENIYAVGNPLGELIYTQTPGSICALNREIATESGGGSINMFQIDAAVNSGNSGGPVYNSYGKVIGIVTAKYSSAGVEGLGFAIPINDAVKIADSIIENGYVTGKAYLGIQSPATVDDRAITYFNAIPGVTVNGVEQGSGADNAGIKAGDTITKLGDKTIKSVSDLQLALRGYSAGDSAVVTVYRNGSYLDLNVVFGEVQAN